MENRIQNANMKKLLEIYHDSDVFSFNTFFKENFSMNNEDKRKILDELYAFNYNHAKETFTNFNKDQSLDFDFDKLFKDIYEECSIYHRDILSKVKDPIKRFKMFLFNSIEEKAKYKEPLYLFEHLYSIVEILIDEEESANRISTDTNDEVIKYLNPFPVLKKNLIRYEFSTKTPGYSTNTAFVIYYFKFNDETRQFLIKNNNDFLPNKYLEDLSFYKNNSLQFVSISHEKIRIDYKNK